MDGEPFLVDIRFNKTYFATSLVNYSYLCYASISKKLFRKLGLLRILITPRRLEGAAREGKEIIDTVTYAAIDIEGH